MCGISGFVGSSGRTSPDEFNAQLGAMMSALKHRGPDDEGAWLDGNGRIALGHRRLAVLDLSEKGSQPMISKSGRYVIAFNGEIYNHLSLRRTLERDGVSHPSWNGHSDTETLLAGIEVWGLEKALIKSVGMFALALWDRQERALYLARDRLGEKPLYYGSQKGIFFFASELKAIQANPVFEGRIDKNAIALQFRLGYIPSPYSIYQGIKKLPPGCFLEKKLAGDNQEENIISYWSIDEATRSGVYAPFSGGDAEAIQSLESVLREAVSQQMLSDVPLGAFLSGGVDSSTIVALMQAQSPKSIKTFSIGFEETSYNEAEHASEVAEHLGTDHDELYVSSKQALDVIPLLPLFFDEPFSDPSQIPTFLVSELARSRVTVALSGDGGDELFGGYNRYFGTARWWNFIKAIPYPLRHVAAEFLLAIHPSSISQLERGFATVLNRKGAKKNWDDKALKISKVLKSRDDLSLYRNLISHHLNPEHLLIAGSEPESFMPSPNDAHKIVEYMMLADAKSYLPDDVLTKLDRAAMAVSLETRVPFLDHRVVEFAAALPMNMKIRNGQGKWLLRQVLQKYVPPTLTDRPKMGFGVPIDSWLRGPLRDWAESLLNQTKIEGEGYLRAGPVRALWQDHLSGKRNLGQPLWNILMFQSWLDQQSRS